MKKDSRILKLVTQAGKAETAAASAAAPPPIEDRGPLPDPPDTFTAEMREIWHRIVRQAPHLGESDEWLLACLVTAIVKEREASKKVETYGSVIKSPSGYPIQSPYESIANKQQALILRHSRALGLNYEARANGKTKAPKRGRSGPFSDLKSLTDN